jgi:asparagine N-glycosylation enzyme membrane subunit Stt3
VSTIHDTDRINSDLPKVDSKFRLAQFYLPAWILAVGAAVLVAWIRLLPLSVGVLDDAAATMVSSRQARIIASGLPSDMSVANRNAETTRRLAQWKKDHRADFDAQVGQVAANLKSQLSYRGDDGVQRIILGDYDSYHWLRMARNYLKTGTTCDEVSGGQCRDTYTNAPVGRRNIYHRSVHIAAIVAVHRVITWFKPAYPLPASSFLVPVIAGVLGVFPAFAIGARLAGPLGGLCAALLLSLNPFFLSRSMGSDDDVWNLVLPLFMAWAAIEAISASRPRRQIAFAMLSGLFVGLDAVTWSGWIFSYGFVLAAMAATIALELGAWMVSKYRGWPWDPRNLKRAGLVTAVFYAAAGLFTTALGVAGYFALPLNILKPLLSGSSSTAAMAPIAIWPDLFSTVSELVAQNLRDIAITTVGSVYFAVSWLGLVLLVAPRWGWKLPLLALLLVGEYLYCFRFSASPPGRMTMIVLLALPLFAALLSDVISQRGLADELGSALIVVIWFLASLFIAFGGRRFVLLMVPPSAITFGVALGRLQQWADAGIRRLLPRAAWIARPVLFVLLAAVLIIPVQRGYQSARGYHPIMSAAWWETLTDLRQHSPSDAIVNTWWDYGYWVKFVADRRVNNDGGSLKTHIPDWFAKVLDAPTERESAGLLRMLDCGSDATPEPEAKEGAYGKLLSYGFDGIKAEQMVVELARMGRAQAQAYLAEQKLSPLAQADILRSTHCDPPPAYLLLSSAMEGMTAWRFLANWNFARAYIVKRARLMPEKAAVAELISRFGYSGEEARSLLKQAAAVATPFDERNFIEPQMGNLRTPWWTCGHSGAVLVCRMNARIGGNSVVQQLIFDPANPKQTRMLVMTAKRDSRSFSQVNPAVVLIAGDDNLQEVSNPGTQYPQLAALVDVKRSLVRLAPPDYQRSTFNTLMNLDGRYDHIFEKVHEQIGFGRQRLTLWKIDWERLKAFDQGG